MPENWLDCMAPPKDMFFRERRGLALTFDDVRIVTDHANFRPGDADVTSRLSRRVPLNFPIVGAAMDTVTRAKMAIVLAKFGGIGVIDKNLSIGDQAEEVHRVRREHQALIETPETVLATDTFGTIQRLIDVAGFSFRSFPVVDENGRVVGLITERHFKLAPTSETLVHDQMIPRNKMLVGPPGMTPEAALALMRAHGKSVIPLLDEDAQLHGMYVASSLTSPARYNLDSSGRLRVAAAIGTSETSFDRALELLAADVSAIVIDTAHGDSSPVIELVKRLKGDSRFDEIDVVAGNVAQPESALRLARAGADGIKVGIGPGSICTTRVQTGVGSPQVSSVFWCDHALRAEGFDAPVIADGGIVHDGDVCIGLVAGAESVMVGGFIAGTDETPGDVIERPTGKFKTYRGMGSPSALRESAESRDRYRRSGGSTTLAPEGIEKSIPYRGSVQPILDALEQYLRSSLGYAGTRTLKEYRENARFIQITGAGLRESHPHQAGQSPGGGNS